MRQRPKHHNQVPATHSEQDREQRPGHFGQVPATQNKPRRGQRPKPMPGITHAPLQYKRPVFALFSACLLCQQAEWHCRGVGVRSPMYVRGAQASSLVALTKSTQAYVLFASAAQNIIPISNQNRPSPRKPVPFSPPSLRLKEPQAPPLLQHHQSDLIPDRILAQPRPPGASLPLLIALFCLLIYPT